MERIQDEVGRESTSVVKWVLSEFSDKEFRDKGEESNGADRWGLVLLQPSLTISTVAAVGLLTEHSFLHQ